MTGGGADAEDSPAEEADAAMPNNASVFKPTKVNPIFLMFYGHIMACGKSYQSAIGTQSILACLACSDDIYL